MTTGYNMSSSKNDPLADKTAGNDALEAVISYSERLAHDANNYIGAILGLSEVLPVIADDPEQVAIIAEKIAAAGRLLQVVINQPLLAYSPSLVPPCLDLEEAMASARMLAANLLRPRIAFDLTYVPLDAALGISKVEFAALLFILLRNAADAIGDGEGRIRVSLVEAQDADAEYDYRRGKLAEGRYFALSVSDSGGGLPEGNPQRLFQPFVSHARRKSALGLGLGFAAAIAERRHGAIAVSRGDETTFTVFLPLVEEADEAADVPAEARIVVVDPLGQWGHAAVRLFAALNRDALNVASADEAAVALECASPSRHVVILRAPRGGFSNGELELLRETLVRRMNADLLLLVGATFPADMSSGLTAISLGADAELADIVNYIIPNI